MWKLSWICLLAVLGLLPTARAQGLPTGPMQEKTRAACLACHTASIIVQQQLDRRVWAKEVDKMIRWGAQVAPADRDAMVDYLAEHFGPREETTTEPPLAPGEGKDKVQAACLSCHGTRLIAQQQFDRRGWTRELDRMTRWGATLTPEDREVILRYLAEHYSPPGRPTASQH